MREDLYTYLIRFGRRLWNWCIDLIAKAQKLTPEQKEAKYGKPCLVCYSRFTPRFLHHKLCSECEGTYMKCWSDDCNSYFRPLSKKDRRLIVLAAAKKIKQRICSANLKQNQLRTGMKARSLPATILRRWLHVL